MGSMLMANGEECLDGWVGASEGEVIGGGIDFGVSRSLLGEILKEIIGDKVGEECGGEEFGVDGGAVCVAGSAGYVAERNWFKMPMEPASTAKKISSVCLYEEMLERVALQMSLNLSTSDEVFKFSFLLQRQNM
nr:hypothetical protein [Tanacetum cinerariifolium]